VRFTSGVVTYACSRPLLENTIRERVLALPNVTLQAGTEVISLLPDATDRGIAGVRIRERGKPNSERTLQAGLVVDASGRSSHAAEWLQQLGYGRVPETVVNAKIGYASRIYQPPTDQQFDWQVVTVQGKAPEDLRAGTIFPLEGGRWMVLLAGAAGDYPPTDDTGFVAFANTLVSPMIAQAIATATPLSEIVGYRRTENRRLHFERMPRWPEQFVVLGDAACAFNPVYGQGMTTAVLAAVALGESLCANPHTGLARRYQQRLAQVIETPWLMATGVDYRYPTTEGASRGWLVSLQHAYMDTVLELATHSPQVYRAFINVMHLIAPPSSLFAPAIARQVIPQLLARRWRSNSAAAPIAKVGMP
jgi:2-polyprenyl-6-methoxyphenol hydroxylase-like FAD-dependent oxidoreductase